MRGRVQRTVRRRHENPHLGCEHDAREGLVPPDAVVVVAGSSIRRSDDFAHQPVVDRACACARAVAKSTQRNPIDPSGREHQGGGMIHGRSAKGWIIVHCAPMTHDSFGQADSVEQKTCHEFEGPGTPPRLQTYAEGGLKTCEKLSTLEALKP